MFNAVVKARASVGAFHQLSSVPSRDEKAKHKANLEDVVLPLLKLAATDAKLPYIDSSNGQAKSLTPHRRRAPYLRATPGE
jgi:hypothetical protein